MTVLAPAGNVVTASFAEPLIRFSVPSVLVPAVNVTDPVANVVVDLTVAVNVTDSPAADGFTDENTWVVVAAWFTVWFKVADVLFADELSPPYVAVIECAPAVRVRVVKVVVPCALSEAVPSGAVPFLKLTVPVGVGPLEVTVALSVTGWP